MTRLEQAAIAVEKLHTITVSKYAVMARLIIRPQIAEHIAVDTLVYTIMIQRDVVMERL